ALVGGTGGRHWWVGTGGWHTGGWHCWAHVGGTSRHRWVHCWAQVGALLGHGWAELVGALLGGTCGWQCWAPIIRALIISALMIGADPRSDNCRFSAVLSSRSDSVRKVQPRTGTC
ncbi:unnamed protein product, partial [Staurois parvus]